MFSNGKEIGNGQQAWQASARAIGRKAGRKALAEKQESKWVNLKGK